MTFKKHSSRDFARDDYACKTENGSVVGCQLLGAILIKKFKLTIVKNEIMVIFMQDVIAAFLKNTYNETA